MSAFKIPTEYTSLLELVQSNDKRTDADILQSIDKYMPVTTEKNVWAFWHSGLTQMPRWCQRNVIGWARICGPEWTIRVIDNVPDSPNYALKFLSQELFPDCFVNKTMDGPFVGPHSADLVRGAALYTYGGAWMDVGSILTRHMDRICWDTLQDPSSHYQIAVMHMFGPMIVNFFVAARKNDPFIKRWHELFVYFFKGRNNLKGSIQSPLLGFAQNLTFEDAHKAGFEFDTKGSPVDALEYLLQVVVWMRLEMLKDPNDGFDGVQYWTEKIMLIDAAHEGWSAEAVLGFSRGGQLTMDLLNLRLDSDSTKQDYQLAEKLIYSVLSESCMMKTSHSETIHNKALLGKLWDEPENAGKDCEPGTFAELLRYGTVHFQQTREVIRTREAPPPPVTFQKGLFEP